MKYRCGKCGEIEHDPIDDPLLALAIAEGRAYCRACIAGKVPARGRCGDPGRHRAEGRQAVAGVNLQIVPITIRDASAFVATHHRHHRPPRGAIFALGVASGGEVVGVATVGRPVARNLADGWSAEVTRVCVIEGYRNACSMLYSACWRAARAMGYRRLVTYTLPDEGGASLRGAGWRCIGEAGGGSWSREARPRVDAHPTQRKLRWEAA